MAALILSPAVEIYRQEDESYPFSCNYFNINHLSPGKSAGLAKPLARLEARVLSTVEIIYTQMCVRVTLCGLGA